MNELRLLAFLALLAGLAWAACSWGWYRSMTKHHCMMAMYLYEIRKMDEPCAMTAFEAVMRVENHVYHEGRNIKALMAEMRANAAWEYQRLEPKEPDDDNPDP